MSVGAAQKQTMHRDDRDWRGWRGGGGQQILESRPLYIPTRPKNRGKGQGQRGGGGRQIMKPAFFIFPPARPGLPAGKLFLPWPGQADGWDD